MGIIQQQALRSTIANYIGVGFGAISRLLLWLFASNLQLGIIEMLDTISASFALLLNFGYNQVLLRLFPKYRNEQAGHGGFLLFGLFLSVIGALLGVGIYLAFFDLFAPKSNGEYVYVQFFMVVLPILILLRILFRNLDGYVRMLFVTVLGTVAESMIMKGAILLGVGLAFIGFISFDNLLYAYAIALALPGLIITSFAFFKTKKLVLPQKQMLRENKKTLPPLMLFGVLVGASSSIIMYVDKVMVNKMIGTDAVGVYGQMFFAAILISVASRGIKRISGTVLAESWNSGDHDNILMIYRKSCLNQMIIAFFFLSVGWACIQPATALLGKFQEGIYVFFFLGLAQLFDMMTGVNAEIIGTSKYYRFNTYFNLSLAAVVIVLNFLFIPIWDIRGAALASFIAIVLVNSIRWFFLYTKLGFQPFDLKFLKAMIPGVVLMLAISFFDYEMHPAYKMLINSLTLTCLYWFLVIKLRLSEDINGWLRKIGNKFSSKEE
ncbi:polysaccharide biosynthesis C-terminal domain-containing protein [Crocinitomix catalasitica]|nr:polysaccharide biosynthesis C-terminal domain-containing protein [Crocinitomix catalasitica]